MKDKDKTIRLNEILHRVISGIVQESDGSLNYEHFKDSLERKYCLSYQTVSSIYRFAHSCLEDVEDEKTIIKILSSLVKQRPKIEADNKYVGKDMDGDNLYVGYSVFHTDFGNGIVKNKDKIVFANNDIELCTSEKNLKKIRGLNEHKNRR